jgi:hypothetical protein
VQAGPGRQRQRETVALIGSQMIHVNNEKR